MKRWLARRLDDLNHGQYFYGKISVILQLAILGSVRGWGLVAYCLSGVCGVFLLWLSGYLSKRWGLRDELLREQYGRMTVIDKKG